MCAPSCLPSARMANSDALYVFRRIAEPQAHIMVLGTHDGAAKRLYFGG